MGRNEQKAVIRRFAVILILILSISPALYSEQPEHFEGIIGSKNISIYVAAVNNNAENVVRDFAASSKKSGFISVNSLSMRRKAALLLSSICGPWRGKWYYFAFMDKADSITLKAAADYPGKCFTVTAILSKTSKSLDLRNSFDFTQYPGAQNVEEILLKRRGGQNYSVLILKTNNCSEEDIKNFYQTSLLRCGWQISKDESIGKNSLLFGIKQERVITLGFSNDNNGSTIITIMG